MALERHQAEVAGRPVILTPKEYAVLQALVEAGGRILTHATLLERVWGKAHREDVEYLRVAVRALRLKIEDDPSQPRVIKNEPGIGYRLA
jgi:two-component system KDP operon response regulator KdpE